MIYLIDGENIHLNSFHDLDKLSNSDIIYYFYSINVPNIHCDMVNHILKHPQQVKLMKCEVNGKNSLDFQLTVFLGMAAVSYENEPITIISRDKGYDNAIAFLSKQLSKRILVRKDSLFKTCNENNIQHFKQVDKPQQKIFRECIGDKNMKYFDQIREFLLESDTKNELYKKFVITFGNELGRDIYINVKKNLIPINLAFDTSIK